MKTVTCLLVFVFLAVAKSGLGQDTLFLVNGERSVGKILGVDERFFRLRRTLKTEASEQVDGREVVAQVSVPRDSVIRVEFGSWSSLQDQLKRGLSLAQLKSQWEFWKPFVAVPRAPAGMIGLAYAQKLFADNPTDPMVLELLVDIEASSWSQADREQARRGRLAAMIAAGRVEEAEKEARQLASISEDPTLVLEAHYVLGQAAEKELAQLEKDNPRWQEDPFVVPRRSELFQEALDHYLFGPLFFGSSTVQAARGLNGAKQLHETYGSQADALECARDLAALYPSTRESQLATEWIATLPPESLKRNPENEYQNNERSP